MDLTKDAINKYLKDNKSSNRYFHCLSSTCLNSNICHDAGLFRNILKLEGVHIDKIMIMFIEPNLLTLLISLKVANFELNPCVTDNFPKTA